MIYILMGPDNFSLRESLNELKKSLGDEAMLSINTTKLEGQSLVLAELKTTGETVPFMAEKRLVIVTGLLGRFEAKSKTSRPTRTERTAIDGDCPAFGAVINGLPASTVLVLREDRVSSDNPLFKLISARAKIKNFPLLTGDKLKQWVQRQVRTESGAISPDALNLLIRLIGSNLWVMANEINKLALLTLGRQIEEADVRAAVSYAQETTVFALVDAILEFKAGAAGQLLERLQREGATPAYVLVMLARQARLLILVRELRNEGCAAPEIQNRLGLAEFALNKTMELAGKYSLVRVKEVYNKLLGTDIAIKTGRYDGELALNILIAELCQPS